MSLNLSQYREGLQEVEQLMGEDRQKEAMMELVHLMTNLPTDSMICHFCYEPFEEYTDLLRHHETCQAIKRNRDRAKLTH